MATRRNVTVPSSPPEKLVSQSQGGPASDSIVSDTRPAVPPDVIAKLLAFTFAMIVMPLGSYFFTLRFVFKGNAIYSGGFAALMANVVLIAYIIVAMREDAQEHAIVSSSSSSSSTNNGARAGGSNIDINMDVLRRSVGARNGNSSGSKKVD